MFLPQKLPKSSVSAEKPGVKKCRKPKTLDQRFGAGKAPMWLQLSALLKPATLRKKKKWNCELWEILKKTTRICKKKNQHGNILFIDFVHNPIISFHRLTYSLKWWSFSQITLPAPPDFPWTPRARWPKFQKLGLSHLVRDSIRPKVWLDLRVNRLVSGKIYSFPNEI